MGREEASIPGVVAAVVFAFFGTIWHLGLPEGHEFTCLCLFVCAFATFFGSIRSADKGKNKDEAR